jgi:hypothetical protein
VGAVAVVVGWVGWFLRVSSAPVEQAGGGSERGDSMHKVLPVLEDEEGKYEDEEAA